MDFSKLIKVLGIDIAEFYSGDSSIVVSAEQAKFMRLIKGVSSKEMAKVSKIIEIIRTN